MDSQIIFVRTIKGQNEAQISSTLLPEGLRRALLMVDGIATFTAISKRAAPSLRSNLAELLTELVKEGYIENKAKASSSVPPQMAKPLKSGVANGELDFTAAFRVPTPEMMAAEAEAERKKVAIVTRALVEAEAKARAFVQQKAAQEAERLKQEADAKALVARQEIEAVKYEAQQDAQRRKVERDAAKVRAEAEHNARENAEAARDKAEQEIIGVRAELEAAKAKAEADTEGKRDDGHGAIGLCEPYSSGEDSLWLRIFCTTHLRNCRRTASLPATSPKIAPGSRTVQILLSAAARHVAGGTPPSVRAASWRPSRAYTRRMAASGSWATSMALIPHPAPSTYPRAA